MVKLASDHFDECINDVHEGDLATWGTYAEQAQQGLYRKHNAAPLDLSQAQWAKDNAASDPGHHSTSTMSKNTSGSQGALNGSSGETMQLKIGWQQFSR